MIQYKTRIPCLIRSQKLVCDKLWIMLLVSLTTVCSDTLGRGSSKYVRMLSDTVLETRVLVATIYLPAINLRILFRNPHLNNSV